MLRLMSARILLNEAPRRLDPRSEAWPRSLAELRELASATDIGVEQGDDNALLMRVVQELAERDQIVIALYYFEGLTLAEIGAVLGVTESRVSQLHSRATATLRNKILALENV